MNFKSFKICANGEILCWLLAACHCVSTMEQCVYIQAWNNVHWPANIIDTKTHPNAIKQGHLNSHANLHPMGYMPKLTILHDYNRFGLNIKICNV